MTAEYTSLADLQKILQQFKTKKITLITGAASFENSGAKAIATPMLKNHTYNHIVISEKYPTVNKIFEVTKTLESEKTELLIVIGGGTVLDTGKAASLLVNERCKSKKDIEDIISKKRETKGICLPSILVPTTAGTGAEITQFAVVYGGENNNTKYSLAHDNLKPIATILDYRLTMSLNKKITAQTACDALSQSIESYWSVNATEKSKSYSIEALKLLLENIIDVVNKPSEENRQKILYAAHLSGKAIAIAKTTAAHALSYPLTAYHGIAHGHACMLTLPSFFEINSSVNDENIQPGFNTKIAKERISELMNMLEVKSGKEAKQMLTNLVQKINLETKLSQLGIKQNDFEKIIKDGFNPDRVKNNPVVVTEKMEYEILHNIY